MSLLSALRDGRVGATIHNTVIKSSRASKSSLFRIPSISILSEGHKGEAIWTIALVELHYYHTMSAVTLLAMASSRFPIVSPCFLTYKSLILTWVIRANNIIQKTKHKNKKTLAT